MDRRDRIRGQWPAAFLLAVLALGSDCLRDVRLEINPPDVAIGDRVVLECLYDMEGDNLYSMKMYKGAREFYRYVPSMMPGSHVFPIQGIRVDLSASDGHRVVIQEATSSLSGNFSCEVSADAPSFHTAVVRQQLLVSILPTADPFLMTDKDRYEVGDLLLANCTASPSRPAALLSFVINGSPVPHSATRPLPTRLDVSYPTRPEPYGAPLESSALSLELRLHDTYFRPDGSSRLTCEARVLSFSIRASRPVVLAPPRPAPPISPSREETIAEPVPERVTSPNHSAVSARHPGPPLLVSMALIFHQFVGCVALCWF